jgi:hypothetical protein
MGAPKAIGGQSRVIQFIVHGTTHPKLRFDWQKSQIDASAN